MKRRKQTGRQRLMRKFALMVYLDRPYGESLRRVAREVWAVYPKGLFRGSVPKEAGGVTARGATSQETA